MYLLVQLYISLNAYLYCCADEELGVSWNVIILFVDFVLILET